ncbi:hypothetical protein N7470_000108 [Penicillium chermesinum]|nr:hypothetical protein N7470_000108 [Penicillium chermesinum]
MPPKNVIDRLNSEGRLELAVHAINTKKIVSIREALYVYDVPRRPSTLWKIVKTIDTRSRSLQSSSPIASSS